MGNTGNIVAGILMAGAPLLVFELISRQYKVSPELTRKAVHILTSLVVVYMTFFLSLDEIAFISVLFLIFFLVTRKRHIWKAIFQIKRKSYGEILFAVGVITAAIISRDERIFACSVLIMGLADPAAAIIGQHYKKAHLLFGYKTIEGTAAFFLVAVFLLGAFGVAGLFAALGVAAVATIAELTSLNGHDNLAVPLAVSILLNLI